MYDISMIKKEWTSSGPGTSPIIEKGSGVFY